jgi:hypothetical protein
MPASLPGDTLANNLANPSAGAFVTFDPLSGPKGSPLDNDKQVNIVTGAVTARGGCSTGALQTGIGFNAASPIMATIPPNFTDDYVPGQSDSASTDTMDSTRMYIGGGRCNANSGGSAAVNPYATGITPICGAGNGGARDGGAGPAFTGFAMKTVTAAGAVANGAVIETGFVNRSGVALAAGQSVFGSATAAAGAVTLLAEEPAVEDPEDDPEE